MVECTWAAGQRGWLNPNGQKVAQDMDAALRGSDLSRQRCRIIAAFPDSGEDVQLDRLQRRSFLVTHSAKFKMRFGVERGLFLYRARHLIENFEPGTLNLEL
jgi:hypothetical protein